MRARGLFFDSELEISSMDERVAAGVRQAIESNSQRVRHYDISLMLILFWFLRIDGPCCLLVCPIRCWFESVV